MTAAVSPSRAHSQRRDRAVHAAAHRDQRAGSRRLGCVGHEGAFAHGGAERPRERVGGQLGRVQLARAETAELVGDLLGPDPRRLEDRASPRERYRRAPGGGAGTASAGVEPGVGDPVALDADRELDLIAAREAAHGRRERIFRPPVVALGRGQVMLEGDRIHRPRG